MARKRRPELNRQLIREQQAQLLRALEAAHPERTTPAPVSKTIRRASTELVRRAATPPARRWVTPQNQEVSRALIPTKPPAAPTRDDQPRSWRELERKVKLRELRRRDAIPAAWGLSTAAAGTIGWGFSEFMDWVGGPSAATTAGLVISGGSAAVTGLCGLINRKRIGRHGKRFALAGAASTSWVTTACLAGVSWWQLIALAVVDVALAVGYWKTNAQERRELKRQPLPDPVRTPEPPPATVHEPEPEPTLVREYVHRWNAYVGSPGGPLEGSQLTAARETDIGFETIVELHPGRQTMDTAVAAIPRVRSALGLLPVGLSDDDPGEELLFERAPGLRENQLLMKIINRPPVRRSPFFEQPVYAPSQPGTCYIGRYIDGEGCAAWRLFDPALGVLSGTVLGSTGSGKSYLLDVIAVSARAAGITVGYVDPQDGASSAVLAQNASWTALGEHNIYNALLAIEEMARNRQRWMKIHPQMGGIIVPGKDPGCDQDCPCGGDPMPAQLVFIDECHLAFNATGPKGEKLAERWGNLARQCRKLGIGFIAATQEPGVKAFGGESVLRSSLTMYNFVAFHIRDKQAGSLIPGLPMQPYDLPNRPGHAMIGDGAGRAGRLRTFYAPRRGDKAADNAPATTEDLFERYPDPGMNLIDEASVKRHVVDPAQAHQQAVEATKQEWAQLLGKSPVPPVTGVADTPRQLPATAPSSQRPEAPPAQAGQEGQAGGLFKFPPPVTRLRPPLQLGDLNEIERAVVEILLDGHTRTGAIVAAYGDPRSDRDRVNRALRGLRRKGWLVDAGHGAWELTPEGRQAAKQNKNAA